MAQINRAVHGASIRYFPKGSNFPPPLKCWKCDGVKFSHTFDEDTQPDIAPRSVTPNCEVCGFPTGKRADAKTCSPKCRKALSRQQKTG